VELAARRGSEVVAGTSDSTQGRSSLLEISGRPRQGAGRPWRNGARPWAIATRCGCCFVGKMGRRWSSGAAQGCCWAPAMEQGRRGAGHGKEQRRGELGEGRCAGLLFSD
jgi:hypothetical protein